MVYWWVYFKCYQDDLDVSAEVARPAAVAVVIYNNNELECWVTGEKREVKTYWGGED